MIALVRAQRPASIVHLTIFHDPARAALPFTRSDMSWDDVQSLLAQRDGGSSTHLRALDTRLTTQMMEHLMLMILALIPDQCAVIPASLTADAWPAFIRARTQLRRQAAGVHGDVASTEHSFDDSASLDFGFTSASDRIAALGCLNWQSRPCVLLPVRVGGGMDHWGLVVVQPAKCRAIVINSTTGVLAVPWAQLGRWMRMRALVCDGALLPPASTATAALDASAAVPTVYPAHFDDAVGVTAAASASTTSSPEAQAQAVGVRAAAARQWSVYRYDVPSSVWHQRDDVSCGVYTFVAAYTAAVLGVLPCAADLNPASVPRVRALLSQHVVDGSLPLLQCDGAIRRDFDDTGRLVKLLEGTAVLQSAFDAPLTPEDNKMVAAHKRRMEDSVATLDVLFGDQPALHPLRSAESASEARVRMQGADESLRMGVVLSGFVLAPASELHASNAVARVRGAPVPLPGMNTADSQTLRWWYDPSFLMSRRHMGMLAPAAGVS